MFYSCLPNVKLTIIIIIKKSFLNYNYKEIILFLFTFFLYKEILFLFAFFMLCDIFMTQ